MRKPPITASFGATALFIAWAGSALRCSVRSLQTRGVCTVMEASTALNRTVDRSIEGPAVNMVTAILRVLVVPDDFDRLL